jgi:hypothetical protein
MCTRGPFPEGKADHSPPSSAEVKERVELYLYSPNTPSWRGSQLKNTGTTLPLLDIGSQSIIIIITRPQTFMFRKPSKDVKV